MNQPVSNTTNTVATGGFSTKPFIEHFDTRDPTINDTQYQIQARWWNTTLEHEWILVGFSSAGGIVTALWQPVVGASTIEFLQGNTGGPVGPNVNHTVNTVGTSPITVTGTPGSHTLTWSSDGTIATSYVEDAGTAIPSGGVLNVNGVDGIATSGSGNQIKIGTTGAIATSYVENSGTAVPALGVLNVLGAGAVTTTGSGNTITITGTGSVQWVTTSISLTMVASKGYICISPGGALSLALPATSALGDTIRIVLNGATSWTITQPNAGNQIRIGNNTTTLGLTGTITTTAQGDSIELVCETANALWVVPYWVGNLTVI